MSCEQAKIGFKIAPGQSFLYVERERCSAIPSSVNPADSRVQFTPAPVRNIYPKQ